MFVFSLRTTRLRLSAYAAAMAALLAVVAALSGRTPARAYPPAADDAARRAYLTTLGFTPLPQQAEEREVQLPSEPDAAFLAYEALQQAAGMTLMSVRGQRVLCCTYALNAVCGDDTVQAHLYVLHGRIVGGDISSARTDGLRQGLCPIDSGKENETDGTTG